MPDVINDEQDQLVSDVNEVFLFRTKILNDFSLDYAARIVETYRFFGIRYHSTENFVAQRTKDTLDIV